MKPRIDHLVIGARDLQQGVAYIKDVLGVEMPYGGVHTQMGTHNHLMRLGEEVFLEILAINPQADPLQAPRWYGLDDPFVRRRIEREPVLLTWVVNTEDIEAVVRKASISFGRPVSLRRGALRWFFGVPDDGRLLAAGMLPYLIEWHTGGLHPAANMPDTGCRLKRLAIHHPFPDWLRTVLGSIAASHLVEIHTASQNSIPYLSARITTPKGERTLVSHGGIP